MAALYVPVSASTFRRLHLALISGVQITEQSFVKRKSISHMLDIIAVVHHIIQSP